MLIKEKKKGNIPINKKLIKKYPTVRKIFDNSSIILKNKTVVVKIYSIPELKNLNFDTIEPEQFKKLVNDIFNKYHNTNYFINDDNEILVTKSGINESVEKIYNNRFQRDLIKEHLIVFANLGIMIENAKLISQTLERKKRIDILYWNYYLDKLYINDQLYALEFEVRSLANGQNQYRIQRLELYK